MMWLPPSMHASVPRTNCESVVDIAQRNGSLDGHPGYIDVWLMARTVGLPTAWNRLLNFHCVRSTKAVVYTPHMFVQDAASGFVSQRTAEHLIQYPEYPDPVYYLSFLGKYLYRNRALRHLRVEQFRALTGIHKC